MSVAPADPAPSPVGNARTQWLATGALTAFMVVGVVGSDRPLVIAILLAVAAVGCAAMFMTTGGWRLLIAASVAAGCVVALCSASPANAGWFGLCVLAGWCALRGGTLIAALFAGAATATLVVEWAAFNSDSGWLPWIAGTLFATVVCGMARRQLELIDALRVAQHGLADRARDDERNRIARELHDVIAHTLTVSLLHVSSARLALGDDPAEADAALAEAERLGRHSLMEVRRTVGSLRNGDADDLAPLPDLAQLDALIDSFRRTGAAIDSHVSGDPTLVTPTVGLTVYRIIQEALTNAVRHAPGAAIVVRVVLADDVATVVVDSTGPPGPLGDGLGLRSFDERAAAIGGKASAGPNGSGWRVRAVLPLVGTA